MWRKRGDVSLFGVCERLTGWFSWYPAGRLHDLLYELAYIGELPVPNRNIGNSGRGESDGPPGVDATLYTSPPTRIGADPHRISSTIGPQELGNSSHHTAMGETVHGSGLLNARHYDQSAMPSRGRNPVGHGDYGVTDMPSEGVPVDSNAIGPSLFSIDPLVYGDMMFNLGYAGAIAPGVGAGQQVSGGFLDGGLGNLTLNHERPEPQAQQEFVNSLSVRDGGGRGSVPNPGGLTMWTNVPHGFE